MTEQERLIRRRDRLRLGAILALFLVGAVPVVAAFAADPSTDPSATASATASTAASATATAGASAASEAPAEQPGATTKPDASGKPDKGDHRGFGGKGFGGFDFGGKGFGAGLGFAGVTITAIKGSSLSLKTDDGWTRTITVTADTKISKGGVAAKLSDLAVGDTIRLGQKRNADGSYTITAITIPTQHAGGEVTAISGNTITLKDRKGATQTITVDSATTYKVGGDAGTKADVKVGSRVNVEGDKDGSTLTAIRVDVQLTAVGGEVTAKTSTSVTVKTRDGKTVVIHVSSATKIWLLGKKDATIADIAVGDKLIASGISRWDGSLDAKGLGAGDLRGFKGPNGSKTPAAPKPSATPGA